MADFSLNCAPEQARAVAQTNCNAQAIASTGRCVFHMADFVADFAAEFLADIPADISADCLAVFWRTADFAPDLSVDFVWNCWRIFYKKIPTP